MQTFDCASSIRQPRHLKRLVFLPLKSGTKSIPSPPGSPNSSLRINGPAAFRFGQDNTPFRVESLQFQFLNQTSRLGGCIALPYLSSCRSYILGTFPGGSQWQFRFPPVSLLAEYFRRVMQAILGNHRPPPFLKHTTRHGLSSAVTFIFILNRLYGHSQPLP